MKYRSQRPTNSIRSFTVSDWTSIQSMMPSYFIRQRYKANCGPWNIGQHQICFTSFYLSSPDVSIYQVWSLYLLKLLRNWPKRSNWTFFSKCNEPWNIGQHQIQFTGFCWSSPDVIICQVWSLYPFLLLWNWPKLSNSTFLSKCSEPRNIGQHQIRFSSFCLSSPDVNVCQV